MAYTEWNLSFEQTPSGGDPGAVLDNRIKELKEQLRFIALGAGLRIPAIADDTNAMLNVPVDEYVQAAHGDDGVGDSKRSPHIYKADGTTKLMTVNANDIDFLLATGVNIDSGDDPGHSHSGTLSIGMPGTVVGRVSDLVFWNMGNGPITLLGARINCYDKPTGADAAVNIYEVVDPFGVGPTVDPDVDGSGNAVFDDGGAVADFRPTCLADDFYGAITTTILSGQETLASGDAWFFDIETINGASGITLHLQVRRS